MSIDFHPKGKFKEKPLFRLTDETYSELQSIFDEFERRTGIYLAPYGKVALQPANIKLIRDITLSKYSKSNLLNNKRVSDFVSFLDKAFEADIIVEAVGE